MTNTEEAAVTGETDALILLDIATRFKMCVPVQCKDAAETEYAIRRFVGDQVVKLIYSDNAANIKRAAKDMGLIAEFSLLGVPKSNSLVERTVQDVLQGTRTFLVMAGLPTCFRPYAAECYCFHSNVFEETILIAPLDCANPVAPSVPLKDKDSGSSMQIQPSEASSSRALPSENAIVDVDDDVFEGATTAFKKRYGVGVAITPQEIPFGAGVWYMPAPTKTALSKLEPMLKYGVFLGYEIEPVAELEDFQNKSLKVYARKEDFPHFTPHITSVVRLPSERAAVFPLKARYEYDNNTLDGLEAVDGTNAPGVVVPDIHGVAAIPGDVILPEGAEPQSTEKIDLGDGYFYQPRSDGVKRLMGPDGFEVRSNSTRPLGVHPDLWRLTSAKQKEELIATWGSGASSWAEMNQNVKDAIAAKQSRRQSKLTPVMHAGVAGLLSLAQPEYDSGEEIAAPTCLDTDSSSDNDWCDALSNAWSDEAVDDSDFEPSDVSHSSPSDYF